MPSVTDHQYQMTRGSICPARRLLLIGWLIGTLIAAWGILLLTSEVAAQGAILLSLLIQIVCVVLVVGRSKREAFEPFVWFSGIYFLLPVMTSYILLMDFGRLYHWNIAFKTHRFDLMEDALLVSLIGYVFYWIGDSLVENRTPRHEINRRSLPLHDTVLYPLVICLYGVGASNFIINAWLYNPFDITALLLDFGARDHRLENVPQYFTTIGYHFIVVALVLHLYLRLRSHKPVGRLYLMLALLSSLVVLSTGRVWWTFSIGLALFSTWFLASQQRKLSRAALGVTVIAACVLLAFVLRIVSNLIYVDREEATGWWQLSATVGGDLAYLIFGRSNVPSLPILMEVIENYGRSQPFLLGETLTNWVSYLVPGTEVEFLGHDIKAQFYPGRPGGFPPTIFGELYANGGLPVVAVGCLGIGFAARRLYVFAMTSGSFLLVFIYSAVLFRFIFMLPKLETAALGSAIWLALPVSLAWAMLKCVSLVVKNEGPGVVVRSGTS